MLPSRIRGYTTGVFDLFHIGHLNLLKNASKLCDELVVGVTIDELVVYKHKRAVIPFEERIQIVESCRYVNLAIPQNDLNKVQAYQKLKFNVLFVGDDWYRDENWEKTESELGQYGVKVIYLPYTVGTSSTLLNDTLMKLRENE